MSDPTTADESGATQGRRRTMHEDEPDRDDTVGGDTDIAGGTGGTPENPSRQPRRDESSDHFESAWGGEH